MSKRGHGDGHGRHGAGRPRGHIAVIPEFVPNNTTGRRCRECGCTDGDCRQCIEATGEPCYWVEPDLCSACELKEPKGA